jgi:hypothetical protein
MIIFLFWVSQSTLSGKDEPKDKPLKDFLVSFLAFCLVLFIYYSCLTLYARNVQKEVENNLLTRK